MTLIGDLGLVAALDADPRDGASDNRLDIRRRAESPLAENI